MVKAANLAAFKAGYNFGETAELFDHPYEVAPARLAPGHYRNISGNLALAYGLRRRVAERASSRCSTRRTRSRPHRTSCTSSVVTRTSASARLQAEDEIAAIGVAIGAAFAGHLGVTATSGPGLDLKSEAMGLAVSLELPLLVVDVQRGGPSTGLPTKTEQADLLLAMYGRHGEAPLPIVARARRATASKPRSKQCASR